jgi:nucleoside-diphosphate-sugar epimerase
MRFTVFGAGGFIGSHLLRHLRSRDAECQAPARGETLRDLGHVIWCAGVTADFRHRPFDTVAAHVSDLVPLLRDGRFESLLYLSSTRVYQRSARGDEDATLPIAPLVPGDLYNASKLMGESLCLSARDRNVRVARLSNVYGVDFDSDNFITQMIRDALTGRVAMQTSAASAKDYVCVDDVAEMLSAIALDGKHSIYNVATGLNVSNGQIASALALLTGCRVDYVEGAPDVIFPEIATHRLRETFGRWPRRRLLDDLESLVRRFAERKVS